MIDLKKENEILRHELAMHKDDNSTKECPGCYMEKVWENELTKKDKEIKKLAKQYVDATAIAGCLDLKLAKFQEKIRELKETIKLLRKKYRIPATVLKSLRK